jgi:hypothetical protein
LLRKQGTFVLYSVFKEEVAVDWTIISDDKELNVLGAHLGSVCWPDAARMDNSGKLPLDERGKRKEERGKRKEESPKYRYICRVFALLEGASLLIFWAIANRLDKSQIFRLH